MLTRAASTVKSWLNGQNQSTKPVEWTGDPLQTDRISSLNLKIGVLRAKLRELVPEFRENTKYYPEISLVRYTYLHTKLQ